MKALFELRREALLRAIAYNEKWANDSRVAPERQKEFAERAEKHRKELEHNR